MVRRGKRLASRLGVAFLVLAMVGLLAAQAATPVAAADLALLGGLGDLLDKIGDVVSDITEGVGGTVGGVVDGLVGDILPGEVGDLVEDLIKETGKTVDDLLSGTTGTISDILNDNEDLGNLLPEQVAELMDDLVDVEMQERLGVDLVLLPSSPATSPGGLANVKLLVDNPEDRSLVDAAIALQLGSGLEFVSGNVAPALDPVSDLLLFDVEDLLRDTGLLELVVKAGANVGFDENLPISAWLIIGPDDDGEGPGGDDGDGRSGGDSGGGGRGGRVIASADTTLTTSPRALVAFIQGYPDGTFRPANSITRAETATIVSRILNLPAPASAVEFPDVPRDHWAADAIARVANRRLVVGYPDGNFRPDEPITRAEMTALVLRMKEVPLSAFAGENSFADLPGDHWAKEYIGTASALGLVLGYADGTFAPNKAIQRDEAVALFSRGLGRGPLLDGDAPVERTFSDVSESHWAFRWIAGAARGHQATRTDDGDSLIRYGD